MTCSCCDCAGRSELSLLHRGRVDGGDHGDDLGQLLRRVGDGQPQAASTGSLDRLDLTSPGELVLLLVGTVDLDLARLGLFGDRDTDGEDTVVVLRGQVLSVEGVAKE